MGKNEWKGKRLSDKYPREDKPLNKESEDLFKIAFRNYLNLIGMQIRKLVY